MGGSRRGAGRPFQAWSMVVALVALLAGGLTFVERSAADISAVAGGGVGQSVNVALPGRAPVTSAPLPSVNLPPDGREVTAEAPSASAHGTDPAAPFSGRFLSTGPLSVASRGTKGWPAATSSSSADGVDALAQTLTATRVRSTCSSLSGESSGSATVAGGTLAVPGAERIPLPTDPAPNTTFTGTDAASGTRYTVVLNEQKADPGAITVTAVHVILEGTSATGDIVVGRSWCASRTPGDAAAPPAPGAAPGPAAPPAPGADPAGAAGKAATAAVPGPAGGVAVAQAAATAVMGGACGYYVNVGLFGGPQTLRGCGQAPGAAPEASSPAVTLPQGGSDAPVTASDPDGAAAKYGPAVIFGGRWPEKVAAAPPSGPMSVSTQGTPASGTVTSSAEILLHPTPVPVQCYGDPPGSTNCGSPGGFGPFPVEGDEVRVTCTASETAVTGTTTFKNAVLATTTDAEGSPLEVEGVPANPPPNYTRSGVISNVGDVFTAVYNEQIVNADGSLTVNGVHVYLFGPTAVGDMVKGQATCGRTPSPLARNDTTGPGCGKVVVAPMGPEDPTPRVPLTELIGVYDTGGIQSIDNVQAPNATVRIGLDPEGLPYLRFTPGQTGPLTVVATRIDEAQPMNWSFEAKDVAGNVTRSSQCPTDSQRIEAPVVNPPPTGTGTGTGAGAGAGAGGTNGAGGGSTGNRVGAAGNRMATTGAGSRLLGAVGVLLVAAGAALVLSTRRRQRPAVGTDAGGDAPSDGSP